MALGIKWPRGYIGLMERLAAKLGVDLAVLIRRKRITPDAVERMMGHCASCSDLRLCRQILEHKKELTDPPRFCSNMKIMRALRDEARESDETTV